jgi:hypothetical protein
MRNNRDRTGRPTFFNELSPLKAAITALPIASPAHTVHDDRAADMAAQRKRKAKNLRRLQREGRA